MSRAGKGCVEETDSANALCLGNEKRYMGGDGREGMREKQAILRKVLCVSLFSVDFISKTLGI